MAQNSIGPASFASVQQATPGLQKVNTASQPVAKPASVAQSPSIQIDERLLTGPDGITTTGGRLGAVAPETGEAARSLAVDAQQQLASQTFSIANQRPDTVAGLFR